MNSRIPASLIHAVSQLVWVSLNGAEPLHRIDPKTPEGLQAVFHHDATPLPFVSAHRGGPRKGFPENCIATFENTIRHTYATLEVDPRYTRDGGIVVHHDDTLDRTTTGKGRVRDHTLAELKELRLKDLEGSVTEFQIPTLDEVIEWARGRTVIVLDQKDVPVAARVKAITDHHAEAFVLMIVNSFKDAKECHTLNPRVMMEAMIPNREKVKQFDELGVPWSNVVAFVGHNPPEDEMLYQMIHERGASCMIGTSRNLDRKILRGEVQDIRTLEKDYRAFLDRGADVIETDIPVELGGLVAAWGKVSPSREAWFSVK